MNDLLTDDEPSYKTRKDFWIRLISSIIAGIYITRFGQDVSFMSMFILPNHQYALIASIIIAYILFCSVYGSTLLGDAKIKWKQYPIVRSWYQIIAGWAVVCLLAFLLAKYYYQYAGYDILKTGYLKNVFPLVIVYIAVINAYYCWDKISAELTPLLKKNKTSDQDITMSISEAVENSPQQMADLIAYKNIRAEFIRAYVIKNDLVCLNIKNKSIFAWNSKNQTVTWTTATIADSMAILPPDLYVQIKRDTIVLASAIEKIEERENKKLYIHLRGQPVPLPLSKNRINGFIKFGRKYGMSWMNAEALK